MYQKLAPFRRDPEGLEAHLQTADDNWAVVKAASVHAGTVDQALLTRTSSALASLEREFLWLQEAASVRKDCHAVQERIKILEADLLSELGEHLRADARYVAAQKQVEASASLIQKGNFAVAWASFQKAERAVKAAAEAVRARRANERAACIKCLDEIMARVGNRAEQEAENLKDDPDYQKGCAQSEEAVRLFDAGDFNGASRTYRAMAECFENALARLEKARQEKVRALEAEVQALEEKLSRCPPMTLPPDFDKDPIEGMRERASHAKQNGEFDLVVKTLRECVSILAEARRFSLKKRLENVRSRSEQIAASILKMSDDPKEVQDLLGKLNERRAAIASATLDDSTDGEPVVTRAEESLAVIDGIWKRIKDIRLARNVCLPRVESFKNLQKAALEELRDTLAGDPGYKKVVEQEAEAARLFENGQYAAAQKKYLALTPKLVAVRNAVRKRLQHERASTLQPVAELEDIATKPPSRLLRKLVVACVLLGAVALACVLFFWKDLFPETASRDQVAPAVAQTAPKTEEGEKLETEGRAEQEAIAAAEEAKRKAEEIARQKAETEEKKNAAEKALAALREAGAEKYGGESFGKIVAQYAAGTNAFAAASYADAGNCFDDVCAAAPECKKKSDERRKIEAVDDIKNKVFAAQQKVLDAGGNKRYVKAWNKAVAALKSGHAKYVDHDFDGAKSDFEKSLELFAVFDNCLSLPQSPQHGQECALMLPGGEKIAMIYVAPGEFMMGSEDGDDDEKPVHKVTLTKGYWLGKYEVTQRQWESMMGANPSRFKGDDRPVENVSWNDCQEFIRKVNDAAAQQFGGAVRLPTEAEWEYACRAGTTGSYAGNLDDMGWYDGNSGGETHLVGLKQANDWGFHDMHGNVCEWCNDWYGSYNGDTTDPTGPASGVGRVLRGGCWLNFARNCRSAGRGRLFPDYRNRNLGLRLCCSAGLQGLMVQKLIDQWKKGPPAVRAEVEVSLVRIVGIDVLGIWRALADDAIYGKAAKAAYVAFAKRVFSGDVFVKATSKSEWIGTASRTISYTPEKPCMAYDNNPDTRWTSGDNPEGVWYSLDLSKRVFVESVTLDTVKSPGDAPAGCNVFISDDGKSWEGPVATCDDNSFASTTFRIGRATRHLKFVALASRLGKFWSIHEIEIKVGIDPVRIAQIKKTMEVFEENTK